MSLATHSGQAWLRRNWQCLALAAWFFIPPLHAATIRELLAEFESGATAPAYSKADQKIGRSKEVSRFQILPVVWRQYSKSRQYSNPEIAWSVAERILEERQEDFRRSTGRDWNYRELYLMWNAPGTFARAHFDFRKVSRTVRERAERFANLAEAGEVGEPLPRSPGDFGSSRKGPAHFRSTNQMLR